MLGNLIAAGSSLIGGLLGRKSASEANRDNIRQQREFAQSGIQWRVADAKKAGIHPLYALGAQTASFAPSSVGDNLGGAISDMGQNIGRAVDAAGSVGDRMMSKVLTKLQLERAGLENDLLRSQIAAQRAQLGPAFPGSADNLIPGQGDMQETVNLPGGIVLKGTPGVSSAQAAQNQIGELSDYIYGAQAAGKIAKQRPEEIASDLRSFVATGDPAWLLRAMFGRSHVRSGKSNRLR